MSTAGSPQGALAGWHGLAAHQLVAEIAAGRLGAREAFLASVARIDAAYQSLQA